MLKLIKQVLIAFLSFGWSLTTKCVLLNNEPCMIRSTLTDLNPVELNYHQFLISLDKSSGSCNFVDYLSTKICIPSKTEKININVFNMITNKNEAKTMINQFHVVVNANLIIQLVFKSKME